MQNDPQDHVSLIVQGGEWRVTVADGEEMREALLRYLRASRERVDETLLTQLENNRARVDPDGTLRVGAWLLETRSDRPVLTRRKQTSSFFYFDVAYLERTADGRWEVTDFGQEEVPLRQ